MSEAILMRDIQIALSALGARMFRNNVGALQDATGSWIKYGIANPGGSDLIGWMPKKITPDMVGLTLAQFAAVEVKSLSGRLSKHQKSFIEAVNSAGGIAVCARSIDDAVRTLSGRGSD